MDSETRIVLIGPPGAGKGTQAKKLGDYYSVPHLSAGELLRSEVENETEAGKRAKPYLDQGQLVPVEIVVDIMVKNMFERSEHNGFVVDGFPRNPEQYERLTDYMEENNLSLDCAVDLVIPEEMVYRRLTGRRVCRECGANFHLEFRPPEQEGQCDDCGGELKQRDDDTRETIQERLEVFQNESKPVARKFERDGILAKVDATGDIDEVFEKITTTLEERLA